MASKYTFRCANQSYAITLEMCLARQARSDERCRTCRQKPEQDAPRQPDVKAA